MKRLVLTGLFLTTLSSFGFANDTFKKNLAANLNQHTLDILAKDVGAALGGGSFHSGRTLSSLAGFDVGVHANVVGASKDNPVVQQDRSMIPAVWAQGELGLPAKINLIARGGRILDAKTVGGGLRVGILSPSVPGLPALSVEGLYDQAKHDYFDAKTLSANLILSVDFPVIHPYLGAGYDKTKFTPTALAFDAAPVAVSRSLKGDASGYRVEGGVNLAMIPYTYLSLGGGLANGRRMYHVGLGVNF